jgi:hypothetical protein
VAAVQGLECVRAALRRELRARSAAAERGVAAAGGMSGVCRRVQSRTAKGRRRGVRCGAKGLTGFTRQPEELSTMPPPISKPEFELRADSYLHLVHTKCNASALIRYMGLDPMMPRIEVTCEKCGAHHSWKLHNAIDFPRLATDY